MGGLASALRLAHRGHEVVVLEKTGQVGGRNRRVQVGGCDFDAGPTLLMMLDPFRKLFADVGERMEDHVPISLCEPSYRTFFSDGTRIDATIERNSMRERVREVGGSQDAEGYDRLMADLEALYRDAIPNFVRKNFYSPLDFFSPRQLALVARHGMLGNLARRVGRYVRDERLRMIFSFQTMYLGLSPYDAPWVYSTLAYMEYGEGIWYPEGGLPRIAEAVADLAARRGAQIRLDAPVARIEGRSAWLENGERIDGDAILVNADLPYAERALVAGAPPVRRASCSAFMLYIDYAGAIPELLHHNVFFGPDFRGNLDQIFHRRELPEDPAFYACISSRSEPSRAPQGHENLMVLVPCPNLERPWQDADAQTLRESVYRRLESETSFERARAAEAQEFSPQDWCGSLNLDRGAAFGLSHDFWQSAYFRPSNRSRTNPNVYFVGASTVPGNGLPMVLISAELAEDRLARAGLL